MLLKLSCSQCRNPFEVASESMANQVQVHTCVDCGAYCYIKSIGDRKQEIADFEFYGCSLIQEHTMESTDPGDERTDSSQVYYEPTPAHTDTMLDWIQEEAESAEEMVYEGSVSVWKVVRASGGELRFNYLTAMRKWIMDGRIVAGDHLITHEGAKYLLEEYPGTADLFSNLDIMQARRRQVLADKLRRQKQRLRITWKQFKHRHLEMTLIIVLLTVTLGFAQSIGWKKYQYFSGVKQAESMIEGYRTSFGSTGAALDLTSLVYLTWSRDTDSVNLAMQQLKLVIINSISAQDRDEPICLLAEASIQMAILAGDAAALAQGRNLLNLAENQFADSRCRLRAEGRYSFAQGLDKAARRWVEQYLAKDSQDAFGYFQRVQLALEDRDEAAAKAELRSAIKVGSQRSFFLAALAELYEKEGNWPEAISQWEATLKAEPINLGWLKRLASAQKSAGSLNEAEQTLRWAMQLTDNREEYEFELLGIVYQRGQYDRLLQNSRNYLSHYPNSRHADAAEDYLNSARQALADKRDKDRRNLEHRMGTSSSTRRRTFVRR